MIGEPNMVSPPFQMVRTKSIDTLRLIAIPTHQLQRIWVPLLPDIPVKIGLSRSLSIFSAIVPHVV
jgi:hypothetical protein